MFPDMKLKQNILDTIDDLVTNFLYYDRKEDEQLPRGVIEQAITDGVISVDEMVAHFAAELSRQGSQ